MAREIPLTRGLVALVDDEDYERVMAAGRWHVDDSHGRPSYAARKIRKAPNPFWVEGTCRVCCVPVPPRRVYCAGVCSRKSQAKVMMHSFITGFPLTDHRNGNGLDNRRANLRPATGTENRRNVGLRADNTSGFKGVQIGRWGRWRAAISVDKRKRHIGTFDTAEEAARAYDAAAREAFGEFAYLNFPTVDREQVNA